MVEYLDSNDGKQFLQECEEPIDGWDNDKCLDLNAIADNPGSFAKQIRLYLCSLKHPTLTDSNNLPLHSLHSTLKKYVTAINNLFTDSHRQVPHVFKSQLSKMLASKRKTEQRMKANGTIPDDNAREEMSFALYRELAMYFLKSDNMFAHLFLVLCWNMMVRNCNTDDLVFGNCVWTGDSFGVSVKRTKTNPDGSKQVQETIKHIYANPLMPEVCPILALAMYLVVFPFVGTTKSSTKLFPGSNTQKNFNDCVTAALKVSSCVFLICCICMCLPHTFDNCMHACLIHILSYICMCW